MDLISACMIGYFVLGAFTMFTSWVLSHKLYYTFLARHPDVAHKEIPFAGQRVAHPEKLYFFFRREALPVLRSDPEVWRLRQQLKAALCALASMFALFVLGWLVVVGTLFAKGSLHRLP